MTTCLFASDLHGHTDRYKKLFDAIMTEEPGGVFLGGDLLPHPFLALTGGNEEYADFLSDFLAPGFASLRAEMGPAYPEVFLILGNDDPRVDEQRFREQSRLGLWHYAHDTEIPFRGFSVFGYSCVPPTPFQLKDWERYDVSRYVPPGSVSPEEGGRTVEVPPHEVRYATIREDLVALAGEQEMDRAVFLFHTPPHETKLDRAALDGKMVDHVPLDVHVGSIAVRRFIEERQPLVTLHGHIHESTRLTGSWRDTIGRTHLFSAAHDEPELSLVRIDLDCPEEATRSLL